MMPSSQILLCEPDTSSTYQSSITSRRRVLRNTALPPPLAPPVGRATFQKHTWFLYASDTTVQALTDTQRLRIHCYFLHHHHSASSMWWPHPQRRFFYKAYTRAMRNALEAKNLGAWATLLQARVTYLPYETHPVIHMVKAISRTHHRHTSVTPTTILIYVALHSFLLAAYAGKTTLATTQRLRQHTTTAYAGSEDSMFHSLVTKTT